MPKLENSFKQLLPPLRKILEVHRNPNLELPRTNRTKQAIYKSSCHYHHLYVQLHLIIIIYTVFIPRHLYGNNNNKLSNQVHLQIVIMAISKVLSKSFTHA